VTLELMNSLTGDLRHLTARRQQSSFVEAIILLVSASRTNEVLVANENEGALTNLQIANFITGILFFSGKESGIRKGMIWVQRSGRLH